MHIPVVVKEGYEADDIIGTLAKQAEKKGYQVFELRKPEPKDLNNDDLCKIATFPSGSEKKWKVGNYKKYVIAAKDRGLKCDVKSLIDGEIIEISVSKVKLMLAHFELYNEIYKHFSFHLFCLGDFVWRMDN